MAQFNYGKMQKTATRLLKRFKQGRITVTRTTEGAPRPPDLPSWEDWDSQPTTTEIELDAVARGVPKELVDGDVIVATDLQIIFAVGAPVELLDTLRIDGKPVTVIRDLTVPAAGIPVAHKCIVRG